MNLRSCAGQAQSISGKSVDKSSPCVARTDLSLRAGFTWGRPVDVQSTLPDKRNGLNHSLPCGHSVSPTVGAGMQLHHGPNAGRILFSGQSDSNNGSVVIFSDTQGSSWDWSPDLHLPGNDETSLAETSIGGVMAIMRNCITKNGSNPDPRRGTPDDCVGPSHRFNAAWSTVRPEPRCPVCNSQPCSRFVRMVALPSARSAATLTSSRRDAKAPS